MARLISLILLVTLTACSKLEPVKGGYPKSRERADLENSQSIFGKDLSWKKQ
jgi:hypothetical protein